MTSSKSTKRALVSSALAILMCVAMLIGTTFAWFTDTASTAVNKIQAGNLDIELQMKDAEGNWVNAEGKTLPFLVEGKIPAEGTQILWEPGCTYYVPAVRVINKGNLAVKFEYVNELLGVTGKLADVLSPVYKFFDNKGEEITGDAVDDINIEPEVLKPNEASPAWSFGYHMKETAGNEYQNATASGICVTVVATQATYEKDSKDDQYDKDAEYPTVKNIESASAGTSAEGSGKSDSKNAFEEAMTADEENIIINLKGDAVYDLNGYTLPIGGKNTKSITINGNGNSVIFNKLNTNLSTVMCNDVRLTIKNATVTVGSDIATSLTWDAHDLVFKGNVAFENVKFDRAVAIQGSASFKNCEISDENVSADTYMLWICAGSNVTLEKVTINGKSAVGKENRAIAIKDQYVENPGMTVLNINGTNKISSDKKAAVLVSSKGGATVNVNGTVDITGVKADTNNLVWKDNASEYANSVVTVNGANYCVEP